LKENWEKVYSEVFGGQWYPDEGVVRFTARFLQRRMGIDAYEKKRKVGRVLDAGCGNGRNIMFFAEQGFDVWGLDISEKAVEIAGAWIASKGLKAHLEAGDITKNLPFKNSFFDVVVSLEVLDHIPISGAKRIMEEIDRILAGNGYIYITLRSTEDSECGRGEKVGNNTYVLQEGYEKGIIQHFFDFKDVEELFKGFKIFDIELHERRFPDIYTVDKAFTQSSRGVKKYLDLSRPVNLGLKYARWHIAAERV
jgi:SAM-dependent methyltransferase